MKFTRVIRAKNRYNDVSITLKLTTRDLMSQESKREFNKVFDHLMESINRTFHAEEIKVIKR